MKTPAWRIVLGVLVGLVAGGALNMGLVALNTAMHAPPEGLDWSDAEAVRAFIEGLPAVGFLVVLAAHSGQAFLGALVGTLVAGRRTMVVAWVLGALTLVGCVANLLAMPAPPWFAALDVLLPLPVAWLAGRLVLARDEVRP